MTAPGKDPLVEELRSGDPSRVRAAAAEAFRNRFAGLHRVAVRITGSASDADDCLQNAFLALIRSGNDLRGECSVSTWLYRVVIRAAIKARSERARPIADPAVLFAPGNPLESASRTEDAERLCRALERLDLPQRTLLILAADPDVSSADIAGILGVPKGTVWSRLHHARLDLAKAMEER